MLRKNCFVKPFIDRQGQNMVEYMLIFVTIILVIFVAMGPNGFFRKALSNSLNMSVNGIAGMANTVNVERYK